MGNHWPHPRNHCLALSGFLLLDPPNPLLICPLSLQTPSTHHRPHTSGHYFIKMIHNPRSSWNTSKSPQFTLTGSRNHPALSWLRIQRLNLPLNLFQNPSSMATIATHLHRNQNNPKIYIISCFYLKLATLLGLQVTKSKVHFCLVFHISLNDFVLKRRLMG